MARSGSEPWILLLDPETVRRRDRATALERCGYRVLPASDAEVAGAVLRTRWVDLVVVHQDAAPALELPWMLARFGVCHFRDGTLVSRSPMIVLITANGESTPASTGSTTAAGSVSVEARAERNGGRLVARLAEPLEPEMLEQVLRNSVAHRRAAGCSATIVPATPRPTRPDVSRTLRTFG